MENINDPQEDVYYNKRERTSLELMAQREKSELRKQHSIIGSNQNDTPSQLNQPDLGFLSNLGTNPMNSDMDAGQTYMPTEQTSFFGGFFGRDKGFGAHEFADVLAPDYMQNSNFNALPELYTGHNVPVHDTLISTNSDEALRSPRHQEVQDNNNFVYQNSMPTRIYPVTQNSPLEESSTVDDVQSQKSPKLNASNVQVVFPPHITQALRVNTPPERTVEIEENDEEFSQDEDEYEDGQEQDMVYVRSHFQGDGRKREAKRHKSRTVVPQEEIDLEELIRNYQNANPKIMELEQQLEDLKTLRISKKELQSQRNRLTAQLSRDRQKLELTYLKSQAVNYQRLMRRLDRIVTDTGSSEGQEISKKCKIVLKAALKNHQVTGQLTRVEEEQELINGSSYKRSQVADQNEQVVEQPHQLVEPPQPFQGFRVLGKRSFAAATALIATVGLINFAGHDVQIPDGFQSGDMELAGIDTEDPLPLFESKRERVQESETDFSMEDAYLALDMRRSYLNRKTNINVTKPTSAFKAQAYNVWKSPSDIAARKARANANQKSEEPINAQQQTTVFCPSANIVEALTGAQPNIDNHVGVEKENIMVDIDSEGNAYLQLVMPADRVNFVNKANGNSIFDWSRNSSTKIGHTDPNDRALIEVACKITEVNRVAYRPADIAEDYSSQQDVTMN